MIIPPTTSPLLYFGRGISPGLTSKPGKMNVISIIPFAEFKAQHSLTSVDVMRSTSGKLFVRVLGERIGISDGTDLQGPLVVLEMEHEGESWKFIAQAKALPEKVATI